MRGKSYYIVNPGEAKRRTIAFDEEVFDAYASQGKTVVFVLEGNQLLGMIAVADIIRDSSGGIISQLERFGIKSVMMTGDNQRVADYVGGRLGLSSPPPYVLVSSLASL